MDLLTLLASDLLAWLRQRPDGALRRVLLWLDPQREFGRLVPYLAPALECEGAQLLRLAPEEGDGQLALKLTLLAPEERPCIVYLPGFDRDALEHGRTVGFQGCGRSTSIAIRVVSGGVEPNGSLAWCPSRCGSTSGCACMGWRWLTIAGGRRAS